MLSKADLRVIVPALMIFLLSVLQGCSKPVEQAGPARSLGTGKSAADESRRKLRTAIARFEPRAMATQTRRDTVAAGLNGWLATLRDVDLQSMKLSDATTALLSPAAQRAAAAMRFSESDTTYIRDCFLLKALSEEVWKAADAMGAAATVTDRDRVGLLFRRIVRDLALIPADDPRVPVGLYEALLTGRGSVDDRVWAFCEALRQRQIDSVLVNAASPGDAASAEIALAADQLVGVVLGQEVLLFDPLRGCAVPEPGDSTPLGSTTAGLDTLVAHERWKSAEVFVTCPPAAFAPRMLVLQERLEAESFAGLFEELTGGLSEIRPLRDRLGEAIGSVWPVESIKVWDVPEQRMASSLALNEDQKQQYQLLMREFDSPFERDTLNLNDVPDDPNVNEEELTPEERLKRKMLALQERWKRVSASSDELFGKASRRLLLARVDQIMGSSDVALIQDLQQIRIASLQEVIEIEVPISEEQAQVMTISLPRAILDVQASAIGDTLYWTSMCQMARNDMGAAVATLRNYRRQYPGQKFAFASMLNEAEALLTMGDTVGAAAVLKEADAESNPERLRAVWLLGRIRPPSAPAP